jgi:alpha-beta hydrolase superfamily lysophospholipase
MVFPMLYNPHKQFDLPFTSALCTRDEAYIKILDTDSREYRTISSRMIFDILTGQVTAGLLKKKMTTPVLFLTAGEDKLVDSAKTKEMFKDVAAKDKEIIDFPGMYHSISVDTGRERVFSEMLRWAEKRI